MSKPNTIGDTKYKVTHEIEDKILAVLPKRIRNWVLYDAPHNVCLVEIFKAIRSGAREDIILHTLKVNSGIDTRKTYGLRHPQASWL